MYQVLSVNRGPSDGCINVEVDREQEVPLALPVAVAEMREVQQFVQQMLSAVMPRQRKIKATLCLSDEEYEQLGKPTVGDEVELEIRGKTAVLKFD
ncbi:MAG: arcadin 1 [Thermoproteus sp.]|jgi:hypothetical protein|nr:arcadin 1 [Thermoproteus sp.]